MVGSRRSHRAVLPWKFPDDRGCMPGAAGVQCATLLGRYEFLSADSGHRVCVQGACGLSEGGAGGGSVELVSRHCEIERPAWPGGMGNFEARKSRASKLPIPLGISCGTLKV